MNTNDIIAENKEAFIQELIDNNYGKNEAEKIVDLYISYSDGGLGLNPVDSVDPASKVYSLIIRSKMLGFLADENSLYSKLKKIDSNLRLASTSIDAMDALSRLGESRDNNEPPNPNDLKDFTSAFLNGTNQLVGKAVGLKAIDSDTIDYIMKGIDEVTISAQRNIFFDILYTIQNDDDPTFRSNNKQLIYDLQRAASLKIDDVFVDSEYFNSVDSLTLDDINILLEFCEKNYEHDPEGDFPLNKFSYEDIERNLGIYVDWRVTNDFNESLKEAGITIEELEDQIKDFESTIFWAGIKNWFFGLFDGNDEYKENIPALDTAVSEAPAIEDDEAILDNEEPFDLEESERIRKKYSGINEQKNLRSFETRLTRAQTISSPLVVDLDGNGYETTGQADGAYFDLDNNGFAERTSWIGGGNDGFITLDLNENGKIDSGAELFGNYTRLSDGRLAKDGFEALGEYDTNADGKIDVNDEIYDKLKVWIDNGNGTTEDAELHSLSELGIASIGLNQRKADIEKYLEATVSGVSDAQTADGMLKTVADFWFENSKADTKYIFNGDISEAISNLPDVRSMGKVPSLHAAMAMDESGELAELVSAFVNSSDESEKKGILTEILYKITGAENVAENSRGCYIDARNLHVIESLLGDMYSIPGRGPGQNAALALNEIYNDLFNNYYAMLVESSISDYLKLINFSEVDGQLKIDASLFNQCVSIVDKLGGDIGNILSSVSSYIKYIDEDGSNFEDFCAYYIYGNAELVKFLPASTSIYIGDNTSETISSNEASLLHGYGGNDTINGSFYNDIIIGGTGDDTLIGGAGDDTYIFNLGDGNDIITDYYPSTYYTNTDKIVFGEGIEKEQITGLRTEYDLILNLNENDSLRITNYYNSNNYHIESFEFSDGVAWNDDQIQYLTNYVNGTDESETVTALNGGIGFNQNQTLRGFGGDDTINGSFYNDTIIGGTGDDTLIGGAGDDTYIFNLGDGNDIITDYYPSTFYTNTDKIVFGEGIEKEQITGLRTEYDLILNLNENDSLRITNYYNSNNYHIESFEFSDGVAWNDDQIQYLTNYVNGTDESETVTALNGGIGFNQNQTLRGFGGDDTINGSFYNDTIIGGTGDDTLIGGAGDDTYIFNLGDGNDIITDYYPSTFYTNTDKIVFGEGIETEDLLFKKNGNNLDIQIAGTDDSITVNNHFINNNYRVENFETSNGSFITYTNINLLIQAMSEFTSDTGITSEEAAITDNQTYSDIVNQMWVQA
jgi:Ca2+-binding RTX toxin-like protein